MCDSGTHVLNVMLFFLLWTIQILSQAHRRGYHKCLLCTTQRTEPDWTKPTRLSQAHPAGPPYIKRRLGFLDPRFIRPPLHCALQFFLGDTNKMCKCAWICILSVFYRTLDTLTCLTSVLVCTWYTNQTLDRNILYRVFWVKHTENL
jgi:hypothetical protein